MNELAGRAARVLRENDRGGHTVPSPHLYPHQWAWDSAFAAIGWSCLDVSRALKELEVLLGGAWGDGRVPHIYFHDREGDYFPGPELWCTTASSSITQPPAWAIAARIVARRGGDRGRLAALLDPIAASHDFFHRQRDPLGIGAVAVAHPWESGRDNCPAFDPALEAIDPAGAPPFQRVDVERVDDPAERPTDAQYARYAALVAAIARDGFGPGPFAVYDPMMTALLARAELDLAALADALGRPEVSGGARRRGQALSAGLTRHLWCEAAGRFGFLDAASGRMHIPDVLAAYAPLMTALPEAIRCRLMGGLRRGFDTPWPLASTAPSDPAFAARTYWRGPVWINVNWLLCPHLEADLAARVRERSLALIERAGLREYFDPLTGEGLGARDFTWTAALALDWLHAVDASGSVDELVGPQAV